MYLRTVCPSCREEFELTHQQRGHKVRCLECDTLFAPEVEEVADEDEAEPEEASRTTRKRRKHGKRPRRIRPRARFSTWPVLVVVGLCVLSVVVAGTALLVYAVRKP